MESTVENVKLELSDVIFCPFCDLTCIKRKPTNLDVHIARYNLVKMIVIEFLSQFAKLVFFYRIVNDILNLIYLAVQIFFELLLIGYNLFDGFFKRERY